MAVPLKLDGKNYPVSALFAAAVQKALGTMSFDTGGVEAGRLTLLNRSNHRPLNETEQELLTFLTHVKNVARTVEVVGAHHDPMKEWGLDGWDAVHGNYHHADCGCIRHYIFDHHSATNHFGHNRVSKERKHHEIEPRRLCAAHGG